MGFGRFYWVLADLRGRGLKAGRATGVPRWAVKFSGGHGVAGVATPRPPESLQARDPATGVRNWPRGFSADCLANPHRNRPPPPQPTPSVTWPARWQQRRQHQQQQKQQRRREWEEVGGWVGQKKNPLIGLDVAIKPPKPHPPPRPPPRNKRVVPF